jgi:hypothetical protein
VVALVLVPLAAQAGRSRGWWDEQAVSGRAEKPTPQSKIDCHVPPPAKDRPESAAAAPPRRANDRPEYANCLPSGDLPERNSSPN